MQLGLDFVCAVLAAATVVAPLRGAAAELVDDANRRVELPDHAQLGLARP
jgi:hypothetical protein